ncbi:unnamed protein product [Pleuronectes platessa]|uniref:Uncharacterized protein n=1 Tax=Pleuronectes platessa TaxID=8262 RepID=A0A9N7VH90_PLEPL|nr:unnamed protein product [Pleuronectes platessa]
MGQSADVRASAHRRRAVQRSVSLTQWRIPLSPPPPHSHSIAAADPGTAGFVTSLTTQSALSHLDDP